MIIMEDNRAQMECLSQDRPHCAKADAADCDAPETVDSAHDVQEGVQGEPVSTCSAARQPGETDEEWIASIRPGPSNTLEEDVSGVLRELQDKLGMPIWLLLQSGDPGPHGLLEKVVYEEFLKQRHLIQREGSVALVVDSPGGSAHYAYKLARLFQRRVQKLVTIVPCYAKSAATLLTLAGHEVILGTDAELGPLDVQIIDPDQEEISSALDAVQSLERLSAFSLTALDQTMQLLVRRTGKKVDKLLPHALDYAASLVRPLLENVDGVEYTRRSRDLKIAEEYAAALMASSYKKEDAESIARGLVEKYPTHAFVIDEQEARAIGVNVRAEKIDLNGLVELVCRLVENRTSMLGLFCRRRTESNG